MQRVVAQLEHAPLLARVEAALPMLAFLVERRGGGVLDLTPPGRVVLRRVAREVLGDARREVPRERVWKVRRLEARRVPHEL